MQVFEVIQMQMQVFLYYANAFYIIQMQVFKMMEVQVFL